MTSVNIPRDDAATKIDTKAVADRAVKPASPYPVIQPVKAHEDVTRAPAPVPQKQMQRRKKERRKQNVPVLLDTRTAHDRRNVSRASNSAQEDNTEENQTAGIDVYL